MSYSLDHYFTVAFTPSTDWANHLVQSCAVDNNQAFYFIKSGPNREVEDPSNGDNF